MNDEIEKYYNELLYISKCICNGKFDYMDVCHSMIIELYSLSKKKQQHIIENGYLKYYFSRMVSYSVHSKSSPYNRKYLQRNVEMNIDSISDIEDENIYTDYDKMGSDIERVLSENTDWYTKDIFYKYTSKKTSFRKLSKEFGIPMCSIWYTYTEAKKIIVSNLKYEDYQQK